MTTHKRKVVLYRFIFACLILKMFYNRKKIGRKKKEVDQGLHFKDDVEWFLLKNLFLY